MPAIVQPSTWAPVAVPADEHAWLEALALLFTGKRRRRAPAATGFLEYARVQRISLANFHTLRIDAKYELAVLAIDAPGRTAMCFLSRVEHGGLIPAAGALVRTAAAGLRRERAHVAQALLEPHQRFEAQSLLLGGFSPLATLAYMEGPARGGLTPAWPAGTALTPWAPEHRDLFSQAIALSYQGTHDCPALFGRRQVDDVIRGHMAVGRFVPELWSVLHRGGDPVGVVLANLANDRANLAELVYLGLAPAWRRQGLGRAMMRYAMDRVRKHGASRIALAVDEANLPAMGLYQDMAFSTSFRKAAFVLPVGTESAAEPRL